LLTIVYEERRTCCKSRKPKGDAVDFVDGGWWMVIIASTCSPLFTKPLVLGVVEEDAYFKSYSRQERSRQKAIFTG